MSMSMRALVDRKVTNRITQMNNRLAEFATPVMRNYDLYVYRNFVVSGFEIIRGNSTIQGNGEIDGDSLVKGDEQVDGNINANGYILAQTFLPGQVINVSMLSNTNLNQTTKTIAAGATNNVFSISFTPKYSNSYLIIEYQTVYYLGGFGSDDAYAYLYVNDGTDNRISQTYQNWVGSANGGGGTRSGVLFPLIGRYTNTNTSTKAIRVDLFNSADDPITVNSDLSTWLKITEVGR